MRRGYSLTYPKRFPENPVSFLCNFFSELIKSPYHFVKVKFELYLNDIHVVSILTCIKVAKLFVSDQCAAGGISTQKKNVLKITFPCRPGLTALEIKPAAQAKFIVIIIFQGPVHEIQCAGFVMCRFLFC